MKRPKLCSGNELYPGLIAGVDEAGRGPIAGPVTAAAVVLCRKRPVTGLDDSKRLSAEVRELLAIEIQDKAHAFAIGRVSWDEIDRINILEASLLAMSRAVSALPVLPDYALVDGNISPKLCCRTRSIVKGDARFEEIAAASILAKVMRDREMMELHERFPLYGFDRHKGYPTKEHLRRLKMYGVSVIHRRSFRPIRAMLQGECRH